MKKLLYLLPFLILNFGFSIGISFMEYDLTSRNHTLIESNAVLWVDEYKNGSQFCAYTLKSENLKQNSIGFNGDEGNYFTNYFGTPPNIQPDFTFVYHFLKKFTDKCSDGYDGCIYFAYELYEPKINCSRYNSNGSCASGRKVCAYCNPSAGSYFNSDTGSCDTNCDLIPNLKFRSDCQCKKAGLGGFVKSHITMVITNCSADNPNCVITEEDYGDRCLIECENGELNLDTDFCYIDDTIKNTDNDCPDGGTTCDNGNNNDDNNNNDDDNSTGGGGSTGGGNNGGNNNNDNYPNGHETTPSGGDNPPSDDTGDDDGECKGENCTPNDITSDYKKMLDDAQKQFDGAYSDTKNQIDGLIDTAKSAINDIKNGGFIQHGKMRITTCPVKSEVIDFRFFTYRFEYDLCEWLTKLYNVFYFLTLVTCLYFGLKWILSHIFNIGGSE